MCFFSSPSAPPMPAMPEPQKPKQVSKAPSADTFRNRNATAQAGGMSAGPGSTFLTGPGGVDPATLQLGRKTLLGE